MEIYRINQEKVIKLLDSGKHEYDLNAYLYICIEIEKAYGLTNSIMREIRERTSRHDR